MEQPVKTARLALPAAEQKQNVGYWRKYGAFYLMMTPALIFLLINNYLPMIGSVLAFKNVNYQSGVFNSPWVGWKNFEFLFSTSDAWNITKNTIIYNVVFIVLNLIFGVALALLFNSMRNPRLAKFHQTMMFLPYFLSWVIVTYLVYGFLNPEIGLLNKVILPWFGIDNAIDWYSDPKYWPFILPIVNTWKGIGYYAVFYLAAIIGIDKEYYEAATIDGASKWNQIRTITLPLLRPIVIVLTLLQVGRIFYSDFGLFYQVTRNAGALYDTTLVIDTYVYQGLIVTGDFGMSSAAGLYQAVVGFVVVFVSNLIIRKISKEDALF
ncbi:sugar ABC transporter permease [Paenibacillus sp. HN-1]|uniref:ABC transporter permease n=1 Tax=Paenibacillus TaxID=44249 RepID=UPI001CA8B05C|nr:MULTISPECIES: ABC transporter permease subunit [Paenibacillus]MBY9077919.1 sugar ABC transporter permease [Paenibacillus sp. CGMCC 1.18879]MBY9087719.1 sugar ABC transporter permease [Paenibacillus sinensis]